jgi:hypothetical protein
MKRQRHTWNEIAGLRWCNTHKTTVDRRDARCGIAWHLDHTGCDIVSVYTYDTVEVAT